MLRLVIPILFAIAAIFTFAVAPPRSAAQDGTPPASPVAGSMPACNNTAEDKVDVRPPDNEDAAVTPVITVLDDASGTPTTVASQQELYLVVITLPPGELGCLGFDAWSNQKNGAVVWMVQQGKVLYAWQTAIGAPSGSAPIVKRGNLEPYHTQPLEGIGTPIPEGQPVVLYPGDWVIQDRWIAVSYRNIGGDSAILLKAVYADPIGAGGGCGGDCR